MRILNSDAATLNIDQLGFEPFQKEMLLEAIHRPYGMVLVTGPTGSGKTVSLYTCLNILNTEDAIFPPQKTLQRLIYQASTKSTSMINKV